MAMVHRAGLAEKWLNSRNEPEMSFRINKPPFAFALADPQGLGHRHSRAGGNPLLEAALEKWPESRNEPQMSFNQQIDLEPVEAARRCGPAGVQVRLKAYERSHHVVENKGSLFFDPVQSYYITDNKQLVFIELRLFSS